MVFRKPDTRPPRGLHDSPHGVQQALRDSCLGALVICTGLARMVWCWRRGPRESPKDFPPIPHQPTHSTFSPPPRRSTHPPTYTHLTHPHPISPLIPPPHTPTPLPQSPSPNLTNTPFPQLYFMSGEIKIHQHHIRNLFGELVILTTN